MYQPGNIYTRTPEEMRDMFLAWDRPDKAFFASGACHILGHLFAWMHRHEGFELIHIKPKNKEQGGHHMFASNGTWAFDFNGWTREKELLQEYTKAYESKFTDWTCDLITVPLDWQQFSEYLRGCHHRPPEFFPYLPWERAYRYLQQFPQEPPKE